ATRSGEDFQVAVPGERAREIHVLIVEAREDGGFGQARSNLLANEIGNLRSPRGIHALAVGERHRDLFRHPSLRLETRWRLAQSERHRPELPWWALVVSNH